jgi:hypothetical protein
VDYLLFARARYAYSLVSTLLSLTGWGDKVLTQVKTAYDPWQYDLFPRAPKPREGCVPASKVRKDATRGACKREIYYRSDGKGLLISNGKKIPRTWEVKGDQVCIAVAAATTCFTFQRNKKNPNRIIVYDKANQRSAEVTVQDGVPKF